MHIPSIILQTVEAFLDSNPEFEAAEATISFEQGIPSNDPGLCSSIRVMVDGREFIVLAVEVIAS